MAVLDIVNYIVDFSHSTGHRNIADSDHSIGFHCYHTSLSSCFDHNISFDSHTVLGCSSVPSCSCCTPAHLDFEITQKLDFVELLAELAIGFKESIAILQSVKHFILMCFVRQVRKDYPILV